jgi:hypothetical protein
VQAAYTELLLIQSCMYWLVLCLLSVPCLLVNARMFVSSYTFRNMQHSAHTAFFTNACVVSTHMWCSLCYALLDESTATLERHELHSMQCSHLRDASPSHAWRLHRAKVRLSIV